MALRITTLVIVAVLLLGGIAAVDAQYQSAAATNAQVVATDETVDTSACGTNNVCSLNNSHLQGVIYYPGGNVTVRNSTDVLMQEGRDYEWVQSNGTLNVLSTRLDNQQATITYGYAVPSSEQTNVQELFASGFDVADALVFVLGAAFVLGGIRILGGLS
jgi:hypothetical protein